MTIRIAGPYTSGVAVGSAGSATANQDTPNKIQGVVCGLYVLYNDTPPATTDVTIKSKGTSPNAPTYNLLALANANTSGWFFPAQQICATDGTPVAGEYKGFGVDDIVNILIAGANASDSVTVWIMLQDFY